MDQDHLDDMEVHFGEYSAFTNNATRTELRTDKNTYKPNAPVRGAATDPRKGVYAAEKSDEELDECNYDKKDYRDGDGNESTKSENHLSEIAREILNKNISDDSGKKLSDIYNERDAINHIKAMQKNNPNLNEKESIESVSTELKETAQFEHDQRDLQNSRQKIHIRR